MPDDSAYETLSSVCIHLSIELNALTLLYYLLYRAVATHTLLLSGGRAEDNSQMPPGRCETEIAGRALAKKGAMILHCAQPRLLPSWAAVVRGV